jgi:hypothetical protein
MKLSNAIEEYRLKHTIGMHVGSCDPKGRASKHTTSNHGSTDRLQAVIAADFDSQEARMRTAA